MGCDFVVTAGEVAEVEGDGFDFFFYIGLHFLVTIVDQLGSCRQVRSFEAFSSVRNRHLLHIKSIDISGLSDFLAQKLRVTAVSGGGINADIPFFYILF